MVLNPFEYPNGILAITFWYVLKIVIGENKPMQERHDGKGTPLSAKVEQMLTEARVIIPGAGGATSLPRRAQKSHAM